MIRKREKVSRQGEKAAKKGSVVPEEGVESRGGAKSISMLVEVDAKEMAQAVIVEGKKGHWHQSSTYSKWRIFSPAVGRRASGA